MRFVRLFAVLIALVLLSACGSQRQTEMTGSDLQPQTAETFEIEAPGCTLRYPVQWKDRVEVRTDAQDDRVLHFLAGDVQLFDLLFNAVEGDVLGTIQDAKQNIVIRVRPFDLDENAANYSEFCAMQEDVNVILHFLEEDYEFLTGQAVGPEEESVFEIPTNVAALYYPQRWKDAVQIQNTDSKVSFYAGDIELFAIVFDAPDDGYLLGTYDGHSVSLITSDLDPNEKEYDRLCAMQEDINIVLQHLMEDPKFTEAEGT